MHAVMFQHMDIGCLGYQRVVYLIAWFNKSCCVRMFVSCPSQVSDLKGQVTDGAPDVYVFMFTSLHVSVCVCVCVCVWMCLYLVSILGCGGQVW